jgi:hypothetical protein
MATSNFSLLHPFDALLDRFLSAIHKLKLASDNFGDYSTLPEEHVRAAWVVNEVTQELDQIREELHNWWPDGPGPRALPKDGSAGEMQAATDEVQP